MLNSELVMQAAASFADRLLVEAGSDEERYQRLYALAYGRPASATEVAESARFLAAAEAALATSAGDEHKRRRQAWSILCQTILASSEFVYVQ
jgi:hypothetical protein